MPGKFECIGQRRSAWCTKAELSDRADSETPRRLTHADYVLHRAGCSQEDDLRLPALRLSAGVLHGLDRDSRAAAHAALPQPAGPPDGADEKQNQRAADGSRRELQ